MHTSTKLALGLLCALVSNLAPAVTITVNNADGAGEGFNDATVVTPVAGNPGTTRGQQRLNAFQAAANAWGAILGGSVTIVVNAQMNPLTCNQSSALLGSAGATTSYRDFTNAPRAGTWYPVALANQLRGSDLNGSNGEIFAQFNSTLDLGSCLNGTTWWYGINSPAPAGTLDFYTVLLHEIGHGLGVATLVDNSTGEKALGFDDIYMVFLQDQTSGKTWPNMTDNERMASAINTGNLKWTGSTVDGLDNVLDAGRVNNQTRIYAPNPLQQGSSVSHFDTALSPNELMEPFLTADARNFLTPALLKDIGWSVLRIFHDTHETGDRRFWSFTAP